MARTISTRSPSLTGVAAQSRRRTTRPFSAMAMPCGLSMPVSSASRRNRVSMSAASQARGCPLTVRFMMLLSRRCAQGFGSGKARQAEIAREIGKRPGHHEGRHGVGGGGVEEVAVAVVAGGGDEAGGDRVDDRRIV